MNKNIFAWLAKRLFPGLFFALLMTAGARAGSLELTSNIQCSTNSAENGISTEDVTGNQGGSDDCWGTFDGNNSTYDSLLLDDMEFFEISKFDVTNEDTGDGVISGANIGLEVGFDVNDDGDLILTSGTWSYDPALFSADPFFIALKAANSPGFAVWLFSGDSADSYSGTWEIVWVTPGGSNPDLSHLSIYAKQVNEPASLVLLLFGLLFFWSIRRQDGIKVRIPA